MEEGVTETIFMLQTLVSSAALRSLHCLKADSGLVGTPKKTMVHHLGVFFFTSSECLLFIMLEGSFGKKVLQLLSKE